VEKEEVIRLIYEEPRNGEDTSSSVDRADAKGCTSSRVSRRKEVLCMKYRVVMSLFCLISSLVLAAWSGSYHSASASGARIVNVIEREMSIGSDVTNFQVGIPYTFVVKNEGKEAHEFTITRKVSGGDEKARDAVSLKDVDNIEPGQTITFDLTFKEPAPPIGMEFESSYPGDYEKGMHLDIIVQ